MEVKNVPIRDVKPYEKNPRKNAKAVPEVIKSLQEFGWRQPLVVDTNMVLIVGHTRLLAAKQLKMTEVPVHIADLSPAKAKAYRIMDNRTSDHSEWEYGTLLSELDDLFQENNNYNLDFFDFDTSDFDEALGVDSNKEADDENNYTRKIEAPIYIPNGEKPLINDLVDISKTSELLKEIDKSELPNDEKEFLKLAASRHSIFNYENIAEYYAQSSRSTQELMEKSALVIIDFNKAIENGFVRLSKEISNLYTNDGEVDE